MCACIYIYLRLYDTRLEGLQEVINLPSCLYLENPRQYFLTFCMLTDKQNRKTDEANRNKSATFPFQYTTAAVRTATKLLTVNQQFDSQHVQQILSAAERPDCPGTHPASNSRRNAFLSSD